MQYIIERPRCIEAIHSAKSMVIEPRAMFSLTRSPVHGEPWCMPRSASSPAWDLCHSDSLVTERERKKNHKSH